MSAVELAARLAGKSRSSAREVDGAHLAQIERVNPRSTPSSRWSPEQALSGAAKATKRSRAAARSACLHGLPVAHKDLVDTAGIRTTRGSPFYRDHVPTI
jgi:amidase